MAMFFMKILRAVPPEKVGLLLKDLIYLLGFIMVVADAAITDDYMRPMIASTKRALCGDPQGWTELGKAGNGKGRLGTPAEELRAPGGRLVAHCLPHI